MRVQRVRLTRLSDGHRGSRPTMIHLGSWSIEAPVLRAGSGELALPAYVFDKLSLSPGISIGMWVSADGQHLHLGPVVGIVTDGDAVQPDWVQLMQRMREMGSRL